MQSQIVIDDMRSWENAMFLYGSAIKEVTTKLEILNDEFREIHKYNPIEYIESRLKTAESIVKKLHRYGYDTTMENMQQYVNDIAGVRVVCSFTSDIYRVAEMIEKLPDFNVFRVKDYMKNPKPSGYRSYHMLATVPVSTTTGTVPVKAEIQIRTIAMDFWASLEHKIYYKYEGHAPEHISRELQECAYITSQLDEKMMVLHEEILQVKKSEQ